MPALIPEAWPRIAGEPDPDVLPRRLTKKTAAAVVTHYKFEVTPRALQDWPDLDWVVVNAKSTCATDQLLAAADRRLAEGRRRSAVMSVARPRPDEVASRAATGVTPHR
jgi:hypothetical protein